MNSNYLSVRTLTFVLVMLIALQTKAQLVINEISQGGQNPSVEYVELVVVGANSCTSSTVDLRNWIIDDNNGSFLTGAGSGIAAGCVRFKNIPFWQNIKIGTIILIYDDGTASTNPLIPADDLITTDGNCRLVIPYTNTTLIERNSTQPSISTSGYPLSTAPFNSNNTWTSVIGMRNGGDSFQTRNPMNGYSTPVHAVSWADNVNNNIIYFSTDASKKVFNMKNVVNDDPANQANWTADSTLTGETPGVGNSPQNIAWINTLNNNCQPVAGTNLSIITSPSAPSFCVGDTVIASSNITHGNVWSTGDTTQSIVVTNTVNLALTNPSACNPVNLSLSFFSTVAAFTADTTQGFAPLKVQFTNTSLANAIVFKWEFGDGVVYNDSVSPNYIFTAPGSYQVVLTAINGSGCKDTAIRIITVLAKPDSANVFEIPNVFTPNNDLVNDVFLVKNNNVKSFSGLIFDRWGLKVHNWTNINQGWDGRTPSGKLVTDGVYFYIMNVTFRDGSSINPTGTITVTK